MIPPSGMHDTGPLPNGGVVGGEAMDHLDARSHSELAINPREMRLDGLRRYEQSSCRVTIRRAGRDNQRNLHLLRREVIDVIRAPRANVLAGGLQLCLRPLDPRAGVESLED